MTQRVNRHTRRKPVSEMHEPLSRIGKKYPGFSGNCAIFAHRLRRVLGSEAKFIIADCGHYEFSNHVAVVYRGMVLDGAGVSTVEEFKRKWGECDCEDFPGYCDEDQDTFEAKFEIATPLLAGDDEWILRLADPTGLFCVPIDPDKLEKELRRAL